MDKVFIFTDGACRGNPGAGGWAALLRVEGADKAISGFEPHTTNNRMELLAVVMALRELRGTTEVEIVTDSQYVQKGITQWLSGWKAKNWRLANNKPVKNRDLWEALDKEVVKHRIHWKWVRGHSGHVENERVDALARAAIDEYDRQGHD